MKEIIDFISQPWAWYASGPIIAIIMFLLLWVGGRFGVSSTLETFCSIGGAGKKIALFDVNWKEQQWNLVFVIGAIIGGYIASSFLDSSVPLDLSNATVADLNKLGISFDGGLAPEQLFSWNSLLTIQGISVLVVGGLLVGFGSRWAGGCTSGHAISGLSNLQLPSLIAVVGFFIGGLVMTFFIFPLIF